MNADRGAREEPTRPEPGAADGWVLVLGATSPIARAVAHGLARRGYGLLLAGRDMRELERCAADLHVRHAAVVDVLMFDVLDTAAHSLFIQAVARRVDGRLVGAVAAIGMLGSGERAVGDAAHAVELIQANFVGLVGVLTDVAQLLQARGSGFIIGITSVAGDRGRQSNYVYGAAKGGFALWLQGLRNRLWPHGVRVITVKPGFIDTEMTFGMPGLFLVEHPAAAGAAIVRALDQRRDIIYVPGFWRWIMWVIRLIPETVFKRMKL
jgi:decaprenylphospho-beta-D-erythro-pentofuranosid-2-ulose 2-reductase